jgi:hypothetical protein
MKKSIKLVSLAMFLILIFGACSAAGNETVPEYAMQIDINEADLLGYEYVIAAAAHGSGTLSYAMNPEPGADLRGDRLLQRYRDAEEKYNITITPVNGIDFNLFQAYWAVGRKYADLLFSMLTNIWGNNYIQNGYMYAFSDMDIDLHCGIYDPDPSLEAGRFGDDYYSVMAYYWGLPPADIALNMWFNPVTLSNFRQPSPHELDEQGEWTWQAFESICEAVRDSSDPDINKQTFGCGYTNEVCLETSVLYSNNAKLAEIGEDGKMRFALNSPEAIEAMDFVRSLSDRDLIVDIGDRFNIVHFIEDRSAFFLQYSHIAFAYEGAGNLATRIEHPFEWIYFPRGPHGQDMKARSVYSLWSRFFYAPANSDMSVHEVLLPYLFQPLPGETEETWQDAFERNNFYSSRSFEYYEEMLNTAVYDYSVLVDFNNTIRPALQQITRGNKTAAEAFASIEEKVQGYIDKSYNDFIEKAGNH